MIFLYIYKNIIRFNKIFFSYFNFFFKILDISLLLIVVIFSITLLLIINLIFYIL